MSQAAEKFPSPAEQTRAALVHAGLRLFGRKGFEGTSTRELAALAKANIGSIAYHFGGKEGLHLACADFIVETIRAIANPALEQAAAAISPDDAAERLKQSVERIVGFFVASPEVGDFAQFVLRELSVPSPALDRLYTGVFEPTHRQLCTIWEQATGEPAESEATRIRMFTLIGQVVYFKIAREAVFRRMGWTEIGRAQAALIGAIVSDNLSAILASRKGGKS
ncbi:MAG: CerR family C-terminal domain-containing protein [Mesorhizobium sp.]|nr:CerR family C-terminal domain-containing protein [Mesorhizobium sp.]MBL8576839.1 CerR family C-terminal domain-containing protein [Mesorhizobium sp.]